jgi:hypothetical protein
LGAITPSKPDYRTGDVKILAAVIRILQAVQVFELNFGVIAVR